MTYRTPYVCCLLLVLLFYRFNLIKRFFGILVSLHKEETRRDTPVRTASRTKSKSRAKMYPRPQIHHMHRIQGQRLIFHFNSLATQSQPWDRCQAYPQWNDKTLAGSTRLFTNPLTASPLVFTASLIKQKHSRAKSRQLRRLVKSAWDAQVFIPPASPESKQSRTFSSAIASSELLNPGILFFGFAPYYFQSSQE